MLPSLCEAFLLFLLFLRDLNHASWLDLFYYPKEIKKIFVPTREALSAISALSAGLLVSHADSTFIVPIFIVPQK